MIQIFLVIHMILAISLIIVVLLQRSEGGGLGIGGGGGGGGSLMSTRGTANLLTRTTAILATAFMATSIILAILYARASTPESLVDRISTRPPALMIQPENVPAPAEPTVNPEPQIPLAE